MNYVAVVISANGLSGRERGDWACFVEDELDTAVGKALEAARCWMASHPERNYHVVTGQLTAKVVVPSAFKLVPLSATRKAKSHHPDDPLGYIKNIVNKLTYPTTWSKVHRKYVALAPKFKSHSIAHTKVEMQNYFIEDGKGLVWRG